MSKQSQRKRAGHCRQRLSASAERAIRREVEREAQRYGVSLSFVVAVALADTFGIELGTEDRYVAPQRPRLRVMRGGRR